MTTARRRRRITTDLAGMAATGLLMAAGCGDAADPSAPAGPDGRIERPRAWMDARAPRPIRVLADELGMVPVADAFQRLHVWPGSDRIFVSFSTGGRSARTSVLEIDLAAGTGGQFAPRLPGEADWWIREADDVMVPLPDGRSIVTCAAGRFAVAARPSPEAELPVATPLHRGEMSLDFETRAVSEAPAAPRLSPDGRFLLTSVKPAAPGGVATGILRVDDGAFLPVPEIGDEGFIRGWSWSSPDTLRIGLVAGSALRPAWMRLTVRETPDGAFRVDAGPEPDPVPADMEDFVGFLDGVPVVARPGRLRLGDADIVAWDPTSPLRHIDQWIRGGDGDVLFLDDIFNPGLGAGNGRLLARDRTGRTIATLDVAEWPDIAALIGPVGMASPWVAAARHPRAAPGTFDFLVLHAAAGLGRARLDASGALWFEPVLVTTLDRAG